jgi:hypothetical protein
MEPGSSDDGEFVAFLWSVEIEDDLGTAYDAPGGAYREDEHSIDGSWGFTPAPPSGASQLVVIASEVNIPGPPRDVGRVVVDLTHA